jgi:hypothetical protein
MRLRRAVVLALVLAAVEGVGLLADHHYGFRARLLSAFDIANPGVEEDALWTDPARVFNPSYQAFRQHLRFRASSDNGDPTMEVRPDDLPPGKRVFVLGESAAFGAGVPWQDAFAELLDARLKPSGTRVYNAGQVAADAWQVMEAGAQVLNRYAPTELVIFTGNNPWISWSPPQQRRWSPTVITILSTLATSRALAGLEFLMIRSTLRNPRAQPGFMDHQATSGSQYALDHPLIATREFGPAEAKQVKRVYLDRFQQSLDLLVTHALARGVRVVLVTLPFNYKLSPAWKHPQFEAFDPAQSSVVTGLVEEAGRLVQQGNCDAAMPEIQRALALDPLPPVLHYLEAECLERSGRLTEAEAAYAQSRETMMGNLGSRLSINDAIRRTAVDHKVPLVDAARLFDDYEHARGKYFNEDLILDDCHMTALGHRLLADALAPLL